MKCFNGWNGKALFPWAGVKCCGEGSTPNTFSREMVKKLIPWQIRLVILCHTLMQGNMETEKV